MKLSRSKSTAMRTKKFVSTTVATVTLAALFSVPGGSTSVVAYAETVSGKSQTAISMMRSMSDRHDLGYADGARVSVCTDRVGDIGVLRSHRGMPVAGVVNSPEVTTYSWVSWGRKAVLFVLRHTIHKLPAKIRPWANKIADILEYTQVWEKPLSSPS